MILIVSVFQSTVHYWSMINHIITENNTFVNIQKISWTFNCLLMYSILHYIKWKATSFVNTTASQSFMFLFFKRLHKAFSLNNKQNSSRGHVVKNDSRLTSVKIGTLLMCFLLFDTWCEISLHTAPHG